jgi:hypothetical protein
VKLETPGKIWLVVLAPPSRMENRGDEGRYVSFALTGSVGLREFCQCKGLQLCVRLDMRGDCRGGRTLLRDSSG